MYWCFISFTVAAARGVHAESSYYLRWATCRVKTSTSTVQAFMRGVSNCTRVATEYHKPCVPLRGENTKTQHNCSAGVYMSHCCKTQAAELIRFSKSLNYGMSMEHTFHQSMKQVCNKYENWNTSQGRFPGLLHTCVTPWASRGSLAP